MHQPGNRHAGPRHRRLPRHDDRRIGTIVYDAGYHSEENISAPGADRLIATGKRRAMDTQARYHPAEGLPPDGATPAHAND